MNLFSPSAPRSLLPLYFIFAPRFKEGSSERYPFQTMDMIRRASQTNNGNGSPMRVSPSAAEMKKPFLIGVAGGTASGKVREQGGIKIIALRMFWLAVTF